MSGEARVHNRLSIQAVIDAVLERPAIEQAARFRSMCQQAVLETETLEALARRRISLSRQLVAWASLT